jgi:hypothetical protein
LSKNIYGQFYLINNPKDAILESILIRRLTLQEYLNFGRHQTKQIDKDKPFFEMEDMNSTINYNYGQSSISVSELGHYEEVNDMLWGKGKNTNLKSLIPERIQMKKSVARK